MTSIDNLAMSTRRKASSEVSGEVSLTRGDLVILIMGPTGAGKSTFVQYASERSDVKVNHDLRSYTDDIRLFKAKQNIRGRNVVFVDTPSFDDTSGDDTKILAEIADFLKRIYKRKIQLAGLICMHRISDNRMSNTALSNLELFSSLCGEAAVSTITLITIKCSEITEEVYSRREKELKGLESSILAKATYRRFDGTSKSAWEITRAIVQGPSLPTLQIQREMVDGKKSVGDTGAGNHLKAKKKEQGFLTKFSRLFGLS